MERTTTREQDADPRAIRFGTDPTPALASTVPGLEFVPRDVLVFWEEERAEQYKRIVGLVVGHKLKLVKITVGRENAIEVVSEAALAADGSTTQTRFVTREALLFWAEPRPHRGLGKTIVVRVGDVLKIVRVTVEERTPAIEVLQSVDVGR